MERIKYILIFAIALFSSCKKATPNHVSVDLYYDFVDKLTEVMIHDIFSPPVAARILTYPNIAAYEIIASSTPKYHSLKGQIAQWEGIESITKDQQVNTSLASLIAYIEISQKLIFSKERIIQYKDSLYASWISQNKQEFLTSKFYALEVVKKVKNWMDKDNYIETRTMSKFLVYPDTIWRWQPTPPAYMDGIEPHWNKIRPFILTKPNQFKPTPPPTFSLKKGSKFYGELEEVYNISQQLIAEGDKSEKVSIAKFWDCNPYVSVTQGHLMLATKKITPGAHWMGICSIACKKSKADFPMTIFAHTKTSIAIFEAFISCWDEKYRSNLIRPETLINQYIDNKWKPILQTPPFPEYTSGHSVVSGASAIVLSSIFGEDFSFDDSTELPFGLPIRSFNSFKEAANEAAISRLYGGIHYRMAVFVGLEQGFSVGQLVNKKLKMTK